MTSLSTPDEHEPLSTARPLLRPGSHGASGNSYDPPAEPDPGNLAELVEYAEAEAYVALCLTAPPELRMQAARSGPALALLTPRFRTVLFNRVIGLGVGEPATEAQVEEILDLYRRSGSPGFAIQLSPMAQPPELPGWLRERGFSRGDNWAKMYRRAQPIAEVTTDSRIEAIGPEQATAFARVATAAFGMPPDLGPALIASIGQPGWRHYLAYEGNVAVATAALHVSGAAGWLGVASTLPAYRRRGAQGALMARRINDGAALGCRWLVTETGEETPSQPNPSYHNMLRTGFSLAYQRAGWSSWSRLE